MRRGYESASLMSTSLQFYNILKLFIKFFVWMYLKKTDFISVDQIYTFSSYSKQSGKFLLVICIGASLYLCNLVDNLQLYSLKKLLSKFSNCGFSSSIFVEMNIIYNSTAKKNVLVSFLFG